MPDSFDPAFSNNPAPTTSSEHPESSETSQPSELEQALETLAGHLVWKMGKEDDSDELVIRVGFASSTPLFAHHPRLHSLSDAEVQAAIQNQHYRVEWMEA
jgi:hypothetical protein